MSKLTLKRVKIMQLINGDEVILHQIHWPVHLATSQGSSDTGYGGPYDMAVQVLAQLIWSQPFLCFWLVTP